MVLQTPFELTSLWHQIESNRLSLVGVKLHALEYANAESQAHTAQPYADHVFDKIMKTRNHPKHLIMTYKQTQNHKCQIFRMLILILGTPNYQVSYLINQLYLFFRVEL